MSIFVFAALTTALIHLKNGDEDLEWLRFTLGSIWCLALVTALLSFFYNMTNK